MRTSQKLFSNGEMQNLLQPLRRDICPQADANEAVQLLRRRARAGSLPGERRDGFKLGLVVEGGGMRGAVSGGGLQALHDLGLR